MLTVRYSLELTAARFGLEVEVVRTLLNTGLEKLFQARKRRPKPHLDSKMLAAWNGGTAVSEARPVHRITLHKAPSVCPTPAVYSFFPNQVYYLWPEAQRVK